VSSELTQVANAIRSVGASAGPVTTGVASVRQRASRLAGGIPRGAPSAGAAIGALERAVAQLNAAAEQLATFSQRAEGFAQRLVMGDSPQSLALARAREDAENAFVSTGDSPAPAGSATSETPAWAVERGLEGFDVGLPEYSDNPIREDWGEHGLTKDDYLWAATSWREVVRPGLERGLSQDDFAAMDAQSDAPPLRRLADICGMYLGDPITLSEEPGGRWTVTSGRHRLEAARLIGDTRLFGKLFRRQ
jgi:hypothetical protein